MDLTLALPILTADFRASRRSVEKLRLLNGLTLLRVKDLSEVSVGYLSEIEQGKEFPHTRIFSRKLAPN